MISVSDEKDKGAINKKMNQSEAISAEERQSIERGLEDSKNARVTPHSEVKKR